MRSVAILLVTLIGCSQHHRATQPAAPPPPAPVQQAVAAPPAPVAPVVQPQQPRPAAPVPAAPIWTRAAFRKAVDGLGAKWVIAAVGKPDETHETGATPEYNQMTLMAVWIYRGKTRDEITGKVDREARVYFRQSAISSPEPQVDKVEYFGR